MTVSGFFPSSISASHFAIKKMADAKWNVVGQTLQSPKLQEYWATVNFFPERVVFESASCAMELLGHCTCVLGQFNSTTLLMDTLV